MAGSVNSVNLVGRLAKDVEVRQSPGGAIASLVIATSESWRDKTTGERKEQSQFHRVSIFNEKIVEIAEKHLRKGSMCAIINGTLQNRKWTDSQGQERYVTEVVLQRFRGDLVLLDGHGGGGEMASSAPRAPVPPQRSAAVSSGRVSSPRPADGGAYNDDLSDSIPF